MKRKRNDRLRPWRQEPHDPRGKSFRVEILSFLAVSGFLLAINLITSPVFLWSLFPIGGWGIDIVRKAIRRSDTKKLEAGEPPRPTNSTPPYEESEFL